MDNTWRVERVKARSFDTANEDAAVVGETHMPMQPGQGVAVDPARRPTMVRLE
jgi:hypothetical protein